MVQNIECYVQWKVRSTAMPLEAKNTLSVMCKESKRHTNAFPQQAGHLLIMCFLFLQVLEFFVEKCFIALRTLGRASRG
jgi:hypothetical protein